MEVDGEAVVGDLEGDFEVGHFEADLAVVDLDEEVLVDVGNIKNNKSISFFKKRVLHICE